MLVLPRASYCSRRSEGKTLCLLPQRPGLVPGARPYGPSQTAPALHGAPPRARTPPACTTHAPHVGPLSQGRATRRSLYASRGALCPAMGPDARVKPFCSVTHACLSWAACPARRPRSSAWLATHAMAWLVTCRGLHPGGGAAGASPRSWTEQVPWTRGGGHFAFAPPGLTTAGEGWQGGGGRGEWGRKATAATAVGGWRRPSGRRPSAADQSVSHATCGRAGWWARSGAPVRRLCEARGARGWGPRWACRASGGLSTRGPSPRGRGAARCGGDDGSPAAARATGHRGAGGAGEGMRGGGAVTPRGDAAGRGGATPRGWRRWRRRPRRQNAGGGGSCRVAVIKGGCMHTDVLSSRWNNLLAVQ